MKADLNQSKQAVAERVRTHQKYARYEINDWIFDVSHPEQGETVLDIGCGTGKQLVPVADIVGESGLIVGIDCSAEALASIEEVKSKTNVKLILGRMEMLKEDLPENVSYDLILCCFALYYSKNIHQTVSAMKACLSENGRMFICGPAPANNSELIRLHLSAVPRDWRFQETIKNYDFLGGDILFFLKDQFKKVELQSFVNPVTFTSVDSVMNYWKAYRLYHPGYEEQFEAAIREHFKRNDRFVTNKVVQGIYVR